MMKTKQALGAVVFLCVASVVGLLWWRRHEEHRAQGPPVTAEELIRLQHLVESDRAETERAVRAYSPSMEGNLDDHSVDAAGLLGQLPAVAQVDIPSLAAAPTRRIVHLRDWHFVPKDLYALDLSSVRRNLTNEDIDLLHSRLLLEVEAVQLDQMAVLRCLVRHHGLRRVFAEGLTSKDLANYKDKIAVLKNMEEKDVPRFRQQLDEVRELKRSMAAAGREKSERYEQADAIEKQVAEMLHQHQHRLLEVGAAGRMLIAGEIEDVLPLDDADLMDQARANTKVTCPACGSAARLEGTVERISKPIYDDGEFYVKNVVLANRLECKACGLVLADIDELHTAEIEPHFEYNEFTDLHEYHEPDFGQEYDNM